MLPLAWRVRRRPILYLELGLEGVEDTPTWVWSDAILGLESGEEDPLGQEGVPILGLMKETHMGPPETRIRQAV